MLSRPLATQNRRRGKLGQSRHQLSVSYRGRSRRWLSPAHQLGLDELAILAPLAPVGWCPANREGVLGPVKLSGQIGERGLGYARHLSHSLFTLARVSPFPVMNVSQVGSMSSLAPALFHLSMHFLPVRVGTPCRSPVTPSIPAPARHLTLTPIPRTSIARPRPYASIERGFSTLSRLPTPAPHAHRPHLHMPRPGRNRTGQALTGTHIDRGVPGGEGGGRDDQRPPRIFQNILTTRLLVWAY